MFLLVTPSSAKPHKEPTICLYTSNVITDPLTAPSGVTRTFTCVPAVIHFSSLLCAPDAVDVKSPNTLVLAPSFQRALTVCVAASEKVMAKPLKLGVLLSNVRPTFFKPSSQSLDGTLTTACSLYWAAKLSGLSQNAKALSNGALFAFPGPLSEAETVKVTSKSRVVTGFLLQKNPYRSGTGGTICRRSRSGMLPALASQSPKVSS
mmetsp:Transcript_91727/g.296766  ORF Transcript_91727/g.296766 Transcript_91727/m.296766 type:complete len:206 (+) Transcript_91727:1094-1711(+)